MLAEELVKKNYKITTGFGLGIGSSIINGALSEIYITKYKHIDEYLFFCPFPQGIVDTEERNTLFTKYRQEMLSEVGIAIFMFANKEKGGVIVNAEGCWEEYEIAKSLGKIIIPLGCTGYMAKKY